MHTRNLLPLGPSLFAINNFHASQKIEMVLITSLLGGNDDNDNDENKDKDDK